MKCQHTNCKNQAVHRVAIYEENTNSAPTLNHYFCNAHFDRCGWSQMVAYIDSFQRKGYIEHRFVQMTY